ncbi:MAG: sugar phosphate nucleotidyltransferase, partial [Candidatus Aenigmatarchaeota archaeon]
MKAVILAGGKGTRLRPFTHIVPKPLLPFKERPILEHIISYLKNYGITDIILTISHLGYQ